MRELSTCCNVNGASPFVLEVYKGGVPPKVQPEAGPGGGECYVVTPTLKVVQKVLKCDVALLSIYNSDWSQKGKFISCSIITLDV